MNLLGHLVMEGHTIRLTYFDTQEMAFKFTTGPIFQRDGLQYQHLVVAKVKERLAVSK
jgi:hypothetical protein